MLGASTQHATTHEERVGAQFLRRALGDQQAHETVVAEPVAHAHRADVVSTCLQQRPHLAFVTTDGREVELVRAHRQLRGAREVGLDQGLDLHDEVEAGEEIAEAPGALTKALAAQFLAVHLRPLPVLRRAALDVELPCVGEQPLRGNGVVRPLQREHLGAAGAHLAALDVVVVEEHEAIEPEIEGGGELADVLRLAAPVDHRRDDVLSLEAHVGPRVEHAPDVLLHVLRAEADDHPVAPEFGERVLQQEVFFVELDALGPNLTDNAAPQRVVAVDDDNLARCSHSLPCVPHDDGAEHVVVGVGVGNVADLVAQRIVDRRRIHFIPLVVIAGPNHLQSGNTRQTGDQVVLGFGQ